MVWSIFRRFFVVEGGLVDDFRVWKDFWFDYFFVWDVYGFSRSEKIGVYLFV